MARMTRLATFALLGCVAAAPAPAQVLTSIVIDGNMADWAAVLADPQQSSADGPAGGVLDRDAPVQSTGRDLGGFAWTWDAGYLYLHVNRIANASNVQLWWFYLDLDDDGLMTATDAVLGVAWKGANRTTEVSLYSYLPVSPGGDPMGDPLGFADGWDMPGGIALRQTVEVVAGGSGDGLEMEARIAWSLLGLPAGSPIRFHVSSSNSPNLPRQIDDNMGGPDGKVGTTRIAGVVLEPDRSLGAVPGSSVTLPHQLTNTGLSPDRFSLRWSAGGGFIPETVGFLLDADGDGAAGPGDPALVDGDGDGLPEVGPLAPGAVAAILAVVVVPAGLPGGIVSTVLLTATSLGNPAVADGATDLLTTVTAAVSLLKSADRGTVPPGGTITYTVIYTSTGTGDAHSVVLTDAIAAPSVYVAGSASPGPGAVAFSHDGGLTFDTSEAPPVTHIRWTLPAPLTPGAGGAVSFQVSVP